MTGTLLQGISSLLHDLGIKEREKMKLKKLLLVEFIEIFNDMLYI